MGGLEIEQGPGGLTGDLYLHQQSQIIMALGLMLFRRSLHRQWRSARDWEPSRLQAALTAWQRQLALAALINGLLWVSVLAFTWSGSHSELRLLIYLVLLGVMASAATFLAPVLQVFAAFMAGIYLPMLLCTLHYFPHKGPYLLPLLLLYGAILARHAWGARRFVQQQTGNHKHQVDGVDGDVETFLGKVDTQIGNP